MKTRLVNRQINPGEDYTYELLKERGLSEKEIDYFLTIPNDSALQDPTALDNIDEACQMFDKMINLGADDRICLVVDCDVDGFTSAAIFMKYYRHYNEDTNIMPILHEGKGHGLADTYETIVDAYNDYPNIKFVVLPDAGSNDYEYHEKLGEMGIYSLMLDHHIVEKDTKFSDYAVIVENGSVVEQGFVEELKEKYTYVKGDIEDLKAAEGYLYDVTSSKYGFEGLCLSENMDKLAGLNLMCETPTLMQLSVGIMRANTRLGKAGK